MLSFPFLSLTWEIRDLVYRHCLEMPERIIPHPTDEERRIYQSPSQHPLVALLAVSKQVRAGK